MITLAKDGMRTDLERIWKLCFNDPSDYVKYFFDYRYNPNACAVYIDETVGRPVAMLHMLDASITEDSEIVPVQYIYAAATRPDYQGKGIMSALLEFSKRFAEANGQRYQILVPGERSLFKYYEARGFYRCFRSRSVYMTRDDLASLADVKKYPETLKGIRGLTLNLNDICSVRRDVLVDREGFVTWDYPAVKFAAGIHEQMGGSIVTATNGFEAGYAFCQPKDESTVIVSEFISHDGFESKVIRRMLKMFLQENFEFNLPVYNEFFRSFGEVRDYGMVYAINGRKPINILTLSGVHAPYLGLALD